MTAQRIKLVIVELCTDLKKIMFLREDDAEEQNTSVNQEKSYINKMPSSSSNTEETITFPYIGPPGTGPGLLGSKPGSDKLEYLTALEHYATSLKSALAIAATLRNLKSRELDVEIVYESICDIESEFKRMV
ncbi:uncharacterized protein NPIL_333551 [Nephila pilipes]|uniref:Uncharacterized protein n=1 Tax=Nephila pilipes TaxID=299642 RepID=A0A8X6NPT1_NEPPI|nr:uncharacterized protein NPIL_333551 [Nephila pilipes]